MNPDGVLKAMRSYQYFAASAISDKVSKNKWSEKTSWAVMSGIRPVPARR